MLKSTRRDALIVSGGAAAGLFFTPVPYKLLSDVAIWSQNWSWIPRPPRGELKTRFTACTLCPAGCGVSARCIESQPIGMAGVPHHPASNGALCAIGVGAHQLPYHPARLTPSPGTLEAVAKEVEKARRAGGQFAFLDMRPGRSASLVYSKFAASFEHGLYIAPAPPESATLRAVAGLAGVAPGGFGVDWENAHTVASVGAPLLEAPGRALRAWRDRRLRIVQVDREQTRTAALADRWLQAWDEVEVGKESPSLALSGGGLSSKSEDALAAFNLKIGAIGRRGGLVRRAASPVTEAPFTSLDAVADGSVALLFIDHGPLAAWPEGIERKLAPGAVVVSFSPFRTGRLQAAKYVVAAPSFPEVTEDVVTPWDATAPAYGIAPALLSPPKGVPAPDEFLALLEPSLKGAREAGMKSRVAAIHASKRGELFTFADGKRTPLHAIESADKLWEKFQAGAYWVDDTPASQAAVRVRPPGEAIAGIDLPASRKRFGDAAVVPPLTARVPA